MSNFFGFNKSDLHTIKANSLKLLSEKDVKIPYSIVFQEDFSLEYLSGLIDTLDSKFFYVRVSFSDDGYPHHISATIPKVSIVQGIETLFKQAKTLKKDKYDVIIQPILNFDYSGVCLINDNYLLVEVVFGHPISLLRSGEYKYRFLLNRSAELLDINVGNQAIYMDWQEDVLVKSSIVKHSASVTEILNTIKNIRVEEELLYEFGVQEGEIIYLECKAINRDGYVSMNQNFISKPFIIAKGLTLSNCIELVKPLIDDTPLINSKNNFSIHEGAYLSHFATYCALNSVGCQFLS